VPPGRLSGPPHPECALSPSPPFRERLAEYRIGKDAIEFPYDRSLPAALVREIAAHRLREVREHAARWMY